MRMVDGERVAEEKMRSARNLADSEDEGRMVAAGYWRGRMEAFAEIEKGRWSEGGYGPKHDGVPPDLDTAADPDPPPGFFAWAAGGTLILTLIAALLVGMYHIGAMLISVLPL